MKYKTLHDEENNEDYYYESYDGQIWYEVDTEKEREAEDERLEDIRDGTLIPLSDRYK